MIAKEHTWWEEQVIEKRRLTVEPVYLREGALKCLTSFPSNQKCDSCPIALQASFCHTALPCTASSLFGTSLKTPVALAVPNMIQVLKEIQQLGEGVIDDGVVERSCSKLPRWGLL